MAGLSATRSATARWEGDVPGGSGTITTESGALDAKYSFGRRFGNEKGTNPEELLGAAHAGCFSMALSYGLTNAGSPPAWVETTAKVTIAQDDSGFTITSIALATKGKVPGIDAAAFERAARAAKESCPLSKALAAVPVSLEVSFEA